MADGTSPLWSGAMRPRAPELTRLGALLADRGAVEETRLAQALAAQRASGRRLGEILRSRGWVSDAAVAEALARQSGLRRVDLAQWPLDPALADPRDLDLHLRRRMAPWRRSGDTMVYVAADPVEAQAGLVERADPSRPAALVLAEPAALDAAMAQAWGPALAARAARRTPDALSARGGASGAQRVALLTLTLVAVAGLLSPLAAGPALLAALIALNAGNAAIRIAALGAALRRRDPPPPPLALARPPRFTLLIPLLREPETLPVLFRALEALDWPPELLDAVLILEADDAATRAEIDRLGAPPFCRVLVAPSGAPRTKPRALNFALDFAEGDVVGIYDAEDRPEPDQLRRVAEALAAGGPEVACVQARLAYFNARENWLTRCFTLEYAIWFDVLLSGFRDLRLPIPLGGTSVFFRREALEALDGWDAHNVTEDADLGMRLARRGWRCEVIDSTTFEEANSRLWPWIAQRSRWLKGYFATWLVHMRHPLTLRRELGTRGFLGFQAVFLGAMVAYFGLPALWAVWLAVAFDAGPAWAQGAPLWALGAVGVVQLSGWMAMAAAAALAAGRRRQRWLIAWIPTLALYWPLGAAAAWLALFEMFAAPTKWRKTPHGLGRMARRARQAALEAPPPAAVEWERAS